MGITIRLVYEEKSLIRELEGYRECIQKIEISADTRQLVIGKRKVPGQVSGPCMRKRLGMDFAVIRMDEWKNGEGSDEKNA